jgi:hypothetical protein
MFVIRDDMENIDVGTRLDDLLRIFLPFVLDNSCSLVRIGEVDQRPIIQVISNLYSDVRIARHVFIPAPPMRIRRQARRIHRCQIKLTVIRDQICANRVRNPNGPLVCSLAF